MKGRLISIGFALVFLLVVTTTLTPAEARADGPLDPRINLVAQFGSYGLLSVPTRLWDVQRRENIWPFTLWTSLAPPAGIVSTLASRRLNYKIRNPGDSHKVTLMLAWWTTAAAITSVTLWLWWAFPAMSPKITVTAFSVAGFCVLVGLGSWSTSTGGHVGNGGNGGGGNGGEGD